MTANDMVFYQWDGSTFQQRTVTPSGASVLVSMNASNRPSANATEANVALVAALGTALLTSVKFTEVSPPSTPAANTCVLYAKDNGAGKTQLVVKFFDGSEQVIKTEV